MEPPRDLDFDDFRHGDRTTITLRSSRTLGWLIIALATVWSALWISVGMVEHEPASEPLAYLAIGAVLFGFGLREVVNTVVLTVSPAALRMRVGPIPPTRSLSMSPKDVARIVFQAFDDEDGNPTPNGRLLLVTTDDRTLSLLSRETREAHLRWLAQRLDALVEEARTPPIPTTYRG